MPPATYRPISELLLRHGLSPQHARALAVRELRNWELEDLDDFFKSIPRPSPEHALFNSDLVKPTTLALNEEKRTIFQKWWPSLWDRDLRWVSAPRALMAQAAKDQSALCVNVKGEWALRKDGYVALSHVWAEGLQRNHEHGGLEMTKVEKVFDLIKRAGLNEEWMWTDVLAIPSNPNAVMSLEDDLLITALINTMPQVYRNASVVLILDALVLELRSDDMKYVALALACGKWARRMWTYQEIKLANRALLVTAIGAIDFGDLIAWLKHQETIDDARYHGLYLWTAIMGKTNKYRLTIDDISSACSLRSAGLDVDYARALFPLLGLEWEAGMTREQGMQRIYRYLKDDTTGIASRAGSRRMKLNPGWAPSYWQGLEGKRSDDLLWEDRGVRGPWYILRVKSLVNATQTKFGKTGLNLLVESETDPQLQIVTAANEDPDVVEAVKKIANSGRLLLLSVDTFRKRIGEWAQPVIVAERAETKPEHGMEVAVHCSAVMGGSGVRQDEKATLLIRHGNPHVDNDLENQLRYHFFCQNDLRSGGNDSLIQQAIREGNTEETRRLIVAGADLTLYDERGNTAIHIAAALDNLDVLKAVMQSFPNAYMQQRDGSKETALTLAASMGKIESVRMMLESGLDIESRNGIDYTPLMIASYEGHASTVDLLLQKGADPNARDTSGFSGSPLLLATGRNGICLSVVKLLLQAGADINPTFHPQQLTPLLKACDQGNDEEVELLLQHQAHVNARERTGQTPLHRAVSHGRLKSIQMLLEAGADRDVADEKECRPIHLAALSDNYQIMQMLLGDGPGIDVNARLSRRMARATPLHLATGAGKVMVAKVLLSHGARLDLENSAGLDSVALATRLGNPDMIALFEAACFEKEEKRGAEDLATSGSANHPGRLWVCICDCCERGISGDCWHCDECEGGDYDICNDCYDAGKRCKSAEHTLSRRSIAVRHPQASSFQSDS